MIDLTDIYPLSDFHRKSREHIERLKATGRPEVLTVNGRAEVVVQDARSYQRLMEAAERADAVAGIRRGIDSMARGEGRSAAAALESLKEKHKIGRDS